MRSESYYRILLVDDQEELIEAIEFLLEEVLENRVRFVRSCNGLEALRKIDKQEFDLIITDLNMPKLEGIDFIRRLRKYKILNKDTPVILLSGSVLRMHVDESTLLKITDILVKPVEHQRLELAVKKALNITSYEEDVAV